MLLKSIVVLVGLFLTNVALAGGMCSSASGGPSVAGSSAFNGYAVDARYDRKFRRGKLAYAKRDTDGNKIKYCVMINGEPKKLSRSRLESLQGKSVLEFANALVDCNQPDQLALAQVQDKETIPQILYYLTANYGVSLSAVLPEEQIAQNQTPTPIAAGGQ